MGKKSTPESEAAILAGASDEDVLKLMADDGESDEELTAEEIAAAELAGEENSEELTAEEIAAAKLAGKPAPTAAPDPLVAHLKDEVKDLRKEVSALETQAAKADLLETQAAKADLLEANESMCKSIIGEYVSGMAIRLGGPAPEGVDKMDMSALFSLYQSSRAALVSRFPVEGKAHVRDEPEDKTAGQPSGAEIRSIQSNTIG